MDWIGLGQDFQATLWIGLDWIHELMDWIGGLGQQKWTHVQH